jgi:hypothetical protein
VILPPSSLQWATAQPDSVLSVAGALLELNQAPWTAGHRQYNDDGWTGRLIESRLNNRPLERLMPALDDELDLALRDGFGVNTEEWTEITLLKTMKDIVMRGSGRFTVGLPLCEIVLVFSLLFSVSFSFSFFFFALLIPLSRTDFAQAEMKNTSETASLMRIFSSLSPASWVQSQSSFVLFSVRLLHCQFVIAFGRSNRCSSPRLTKGSVFFGAQRTEHHHCLSLWTISRPCSDSYKPTDQGNSISTT